MPTAPLARLDTVCVTFRGAPALRNISLTLQRGVHTALLGPNGAGKSTLMRVLRGELYPDVRADTRTDARVNPHTGVSSDADAGADADAPSVLWYPDGEADRSPLAGRSMVAAVTVAQVERYAQQGRGVSGEDLLLTGLEDGDFLYAEPSAAAVALVRAKAVEHNLEGLLNRPILELSRGELSALLLVRALIRRPKLLIVDEIFSGLDAKAHRAMLHSLNLAAKESTLLVASHRASDLPECISREIHMSAGWIVFDGPRSSAPQGRVEGGICEGAVVNSESPMLIAARNVTVFIHGKAVLHDLNWTLRQGESWAVTGGNGAGKSVFLRLLGGEYYAAAGGSLTRFDPAGGEAVRTLAETRRLFRLVPDFAPAQARSATGLELVLTGFDAGMGVYRTAEAAQEQEALHWMRAVGAEAFAAQPARRLSTGQLRRLMLARALVDGPCTLLLDDPLAGLDAASRETLHGIFADLTARGVQLILAAHHGEDIPSSVRHTLHLENGRSDRRNDC